jgi:hypothetical protein
LRSSQGIRVRLALTSVDIKPEGFGSQGIDSLSVLSGAIGGASVVNGKSTGVGREDDLRKLFQGRREAVPDIFTLEYRGALHPLGRQDRAQEL